MVQVHGSRGLRRIQQGQQRCGHCGFGREREQPEEQRSDREIGASNEYGIQYKE